MRTWTAVFLGFWTFVALLARADVATVLWLAQAGAVALAVLVIPCAVGRAIRRLGHFENALPVRPAREEGVPRPRPAVAARDGVAVPVEWPRSVAPRAASSPHSRPRLGPR